MGKFRFSNKSELLLSRVHEDLSRLMHESLSKSTIDFGITYGMRDIEKQKEFVSSGASQTMNSRHLTGHAIDLMVYADGVYQEGKTKASLNYYFDLYHVIQSTANEIGVSIEWGGHWKSIHDYGHYQLSWKCYPLK